MAKVQRLLDPRSACGAKAAHPEQTSYLYWIIASGGAQLQKGNVLYLANMIFPCGESGRRSGRRRFSANPGERLTVAIPGRVVSRPHKLHNP
ncbi:MAG: hypothetical protein ACXU8Q_08320, partial [Caulobacteraceae bacterium]